MTALDETQRNFTSRSTATHEYESVPPTGGNPRQNVLDVGAGLARVLCSPQAKNKQRNTDGGGGRLI